MEMKYSDYVDYEKLDPIKRLFLERAASTHSHIKRFGIEYRLESVGEAAAVYDFVDQDFMIALILESLGTKVLDADRIYGKIEVAKLFFGKKIYSGIGQDMIGMIVYDLNNVGAQPVGLGDVMVSGVSAYFNDEKRNEELVDGFVEGTNLSKASLACGDTPTFPGIVNSDTLCITGGGFGIIKPKSRFTAGGMRIRAGDIIYGFPSNGMHTNGLSLSRPIIEKQPEGYVSKLPNGKMIGEEILKPTRIYSELLDNLFNAGVDIHYISHITGHGHRKIARAKREISYVIEYLPEPQQEFLWLMEKGPVSKTEAYKTWNMGVGLVIMASQTDCSKIAQVSKADGIESFELGYVEDGPRVVRMPFEENGKQVVLVP